MIDDNDLEQGETGATGEEEEESIGEDGDDELETAIDNGEVPEGAVEVDVETAEYTITGLVDTMDEQGNITGQLPIGSVQTLPVVVGDKAVADGRAEKVE